MRKKDKSILDELNENKKEESFGRNDLLSFLIGVILLGAGLFMLSKRVIVHSSWYIWRIGNFNLSSGLVTVPLIIGIIWRFYNPKSIAAKIFIVLGVVFIVATIIMGIQINFMPTSLYDYIIIIGMAAAGTGLLLKSVFKKKN